MWKSLLAILCAAGTVLAYNEPQSVHAPITNRTKDEKPNRIKIFTCPAGFVLVRKNCFYLSSGTATFQDAHFSCQDRNATLATLPKKYMDRQLRQYLLRPDMEPLERWIGARYNWGTSYWEWGIIGEKISYDGFSKFESGKDLWHEWKCAAMNPKRKFRWASRSCVDKLHYVCHVPATKKGRGKLPVKRLGRVKQNQNKKGTSIKNMNDRNDIMPYSQGPLRTTRKSRPMWRNGKKLGLRRPIPITDWAPGAQYSDRLAFVKGKGPNEPDRWVSRSKLTTISENHLDPELIKESEVKNTNGFRTGIKTLSARTDMGQIDQFTGIASDEKVLFKY